MFSVPFQIQCSQLRYGQHLPLLQLHITHLSSLYYTSLPRSKPADPGLKLNITPILHVPAMTSDSSPFQHPLPTCITSSYILLISTSSTQSHKSLSFIITVHWHIDPTSLSTSYFPLNCKYSSHHPIPLSIPNLSAITLLACPHPALLTSYHTGHSLLLSPNFLHPMTPTSSLLLLQVLLAPNRLLLTHI